MRIIIALQLFVLLLWMSFWGGIIWTVCHFVAKFW